jgi:hypothetical protein
VFVASGIQHAMHIRHIFIVVCPVEEYFTPFTHKRHDYRKNVIEHKMYISIFSATFA